jgi:predicted adenine nucleotide alpha hydrolase (AANH) superfamily ATPase
VRTRLSICLKKARYRSYEDALAAVRGADIPLRPYRCERCWQYHLTSRIKGKWIPRKPD